MAQVVHGDGPRKKSKTGEDVGTKWLSLAMEMEEERKASLERMVATAQLMLALIKGVVDVGVFFYPQTNSEKRQLCLSFKLDD